jgi:uncharacterized repeat protein (TIGR03803 family)
MDTSGALYGTTTLGSVFKLTPNADGSWSFSVIYNGAASYGTLLIDPSGALYGTTAQGGTNGAGTIFQLTQVGGVWTESILYSFTGTNGDGVFPQAGLISDASGALYGVASGTYYSNGAASGFGTIFKLSPPAATGSAWNFSVPHTFNGSDGASPLANLIPDASGALYGTTRLGGPGSGQCLGGTLSCGGTVFKLTLPATFTGVPGQANCTGQSIAFAAKKYGGIAHAAESLGYSSVMAFQSGVLACCGG